MGNESSRPESADGRSRSLSPLPRDDMLSHDERDDFPSTMPANMPVAYGSDADAAAVEPHDASPKRSRTRKKEKKKRKEATRNYVSDEEPPAEAEHSVLDFDQEPPTSAQPPRKRARRNSDSKGRKKRKTAQPSDKRSESLGKDKREDEASQPLDQGPSQPANGDSGIEVDPNPHSLLDDSVKAEPEEPEEREESVAAHSGFTLRPSPFDSQQHTANVRASRKRKSIFDIQPSQPDPEDAETQSTADHGDPMDLSVPDGLPNFAGYNGPTQPDDDALSIASMPHGLPTAYDLPTPSPEGFRSLVIPAAHQASVHDNEETTPEDPIPPSTAPLSTAKSPVPRSSVKRKAKRPVILPDEQENVAAFATLPLKEVADSPKPRRSTRPPKPSVKKEPVAPTPTRKMPRKKPKEAVAANDAAEEPAEESDGQSTRNASGYRTGRLTTREQNQIVRAVERVREDESFSQEEINQIIHENPQANGKAVHHRLWSAIQDACPSRPRRKLKEWCRQRFHNFVGRGAWTQEQDDELANLVEVHGKKWSLIGGLINRHQKDARDRWRNYLVCRESVKMSAWSEEEEQHLRDAVENAIEKIRASQSADASKAPEELVNWLDISETLDRTRSRLQCMEKWRRMCAAEPIGGEVPTILPQGSSWRLEKARDDLRRMRAKHRYELMRTIRDSEVGHDSRINWKEIVHETFGGKFERQALVVAWGRLRQAVPDWEEKTTHECATYLCNMYEREGDFGDEDEPAEKVEADEPEAEEQAEVVPPVKKGRKGEAKSKEFISPSPEPEPAPATEPKKSKFAKAKTTKRIKPSSTQLEPASSHASPTPTTFPIQTYLRSKTPTSPTPPPSSKPKSQLITLDLSQDPSLASPSVEAQASRIRRRENRSSTEGRRRRSSSGSAAAQEIDPVPRSSTEPKNPKGSKSQRRESTASNNNHDGEVEEGTKPNFPAGKSWSVISSDMDDMEDIPAMLPPSSQAA
ncbi:hypothetical protein N0V88_005973 [Collariella sp. IMI 366227]|nr:hypothetical protein N0V88_005973 [Collariella sp. IMI 366227]